MPRNFRRRVEIMFPIEDPELKARLVDGILGVVLADNVKARELQPDGTYRRVAPAKPGEPTIRSQVEFQNMALELGEASPISHPAAAIAAPAARVKFTAGGYQSEAQARDPGLPHPNGENRERRIPVLLAPTAKTASEGSRSPSPQRLFRNSVGAVSVVQARPLVRWIRLLTYSNMSQTHVPAVSRRSDAFFSSNLL